ncbi:hypothetical protein ATANTOWER_027816, partial [Ataeniobius toweri]|nr:hypothetical protein [Ataeniobius toweri]
PKEKAECCHVHERGLIRVITAGKHQYFIPGKYPGDGHTFLMSSQEDPSLSFMVSITHLELMLRQKWKVLWPF